jgi:hypothetical protein
MRNKFIAYCVLRKAILQQQFRSAVWLMKMLCWKFSDISIHLVVEAGETIVQTVACKFGIQTRTDPASCAPRVPREKCKVSRN